MYYCEKCGKYFNQPRLSPRKEMQSGGLFSSPVYDLGVYISHGEHSSWVSFYYYRHDLFCPRCGRLYDTMGYFDGLYWARHFGETASRDDITRYFRYCAAHPEAKQNIYVGTHHGYPGDMV